MANTKGSHDHLDLRKKFTTLIFSLERQTNFIPVLFYIIILPILFVYVKFQSIVSLSIYSIIMY